MYCSAVDLGGSMKLLVVFVLALLISPWVNAKSLYSYECESDVSVVTDSTSFKKFHLLATDKGFLVNQTSEIHSVAMVFGEDLFSSVFEFAGSVKATLGKDFQFLFSYGLPQKTASGYVTLVDPSNPDSQTEFHCSLDWSPY